VYRKILAADRASVGARGGHGNAIAQVYNHMILPLASRRDKVTQVAWGLADFRARFGREPEGLWLPETAVDTETLEVLAEAGVTFTILAPDQAARVRPTGAGDWEATSGGVDPRRPSADPRGGDPRAHLVVLRPRRRALAQRLRLPRARHHAPALARAAAREPRLAARRDRRLLRDARGHLAQGSVGGARRLRQRAPRPQPPAARRLLRPPPALVARSHRAAGGAPPPRAAAEPPAHVHLVRLVLRRAVGDRAGADPSLRGHGAPVPRRPRRPA